jgi:hypothetical protein
VDRVSFFHGPESSALLYWAVEGGGAGAPRRRALPAARV